MSRKSVLAMVFILFGSIAYADPQPLPDVTRGQLLYLNALHCLP